jgi:cytochrome c oxidase cbb3-type subunit I/II
MSAPAVSAAETALDTITYDNRIVRDFLIAMLVWGFVGMLVGVLLSLQLAWPQANFDLPWLSFGRIRPLHTNAVIFAFAGNGIFAGIYYSMQRLCKTRMWSDALGRFHFWGWQAIIVSAAITLPLGITTSKEYAELEWPIKIAIAVVWLGFGANLIGTVLTRRERHLYVAIWFYLATFLAITMLHVVNSLQIPVTLWKSYPVYAGVQDALVQWWYGHNAVAFFLTTPFLGIMYYFLPKAAERPVYSYRLSIVHFWSLIFIYIWAGPHHLLNSALPEWAQTLGVVFSVMLIAPSWGGMINGLLTLRGAWDRVRTSAILKFYVLAITAYGMTTFEGCLLSLRDVNALSHNTDWTIAHVHNGALGWVAFLLFGMAYWLVPKLWKVPLWSEKLADFHFWIATLAIVIYALAIWTAGITEGAMQLAFDDKGQLMYRDFMEVVRFAVPCYWFRVVAGLLYLSGIAMCMVNLWMSVRRARIQDDTVQVPRLDVSDPPLQMVGAVASAQVPPREKATLLHSLVERWPTMMIALSCILLAIGGVLEIIPSLIQGALTPRIASVTPYTPLELTGRDIYIREGCSQCHTQMIRTLRAETERYGAYHRPGEFIYDRPFLWGSKRTGPDLGRVSRSKPSVAWHYDHLVAPVSVAPYSVMPAYPWLARDDMDLTTLQAKMRALSIPILPRCYTARDIDTAIDEAKDQAKRLVARMREQKAALNDVPDLERKEIVALIAYLMRLGTDLDKPAAPAAIATEVR